MGDTNKPDKAIADFIRSLDNPLLDMDYRPGHERVRRLLSFLDLHRPRLRIRIAGTNGKGSTGYCLEQLLLAHGYRVGYYNSPHIFRFNERIRIGGSPASDDFLLPIMKQLLPLGETVGTSPFELATAVALQAFSTAGVDVEILECGMGARLDATTAVPAQVALITPIGLDHQAWLGDTVGKIADDKAYALHGCAYGFTSDRQAPEVLDILRRHFPDLQVLAEPGRHPWPNLPGYLQHNAALALFALRQVSRREGLRFDEAKAAETIAHLRLEGRLSHHRYRDADIWLDAAHNRHAVEALLADLPALSAHFDSIMVFTRRDRSLDDALPLLAPYGDILTRRDYPALGLAMDAVIGDGGTGRHLILGSFTTVSEAIRWLQAHGAA